MWLNELSVSIIYTPVIKQKKHPDFCWMCTNMSQPIGALLPIGVIVVEVLVLLSRIGQYVILKTVKPPKMFPQSAGVTITELTALYH